MRLRHSCEPACVGIIPNLFLKREGVVRSLHPTHSIAAWGKEAKTYIKGEENCITPCAPGGCWDRLREIKAKILLVGVTHSRNTFIHSVEEFYEVPERFTKEPTHFKLKQADGTLKEVAMYRHYNPQTAHISESYDKLMEAFYETGAAQKVQFGDATCILCDAQALFKVTSKVLEREINGLISCEEIPKAWWQED